MVLNSKNGIEKARIEKNLTILELAKLLNVEITVMKGIEEGVIFPSFDNLLKLCQILESSADKLMYGDNREPLSLYGLSENQVETIRYLYRNLKYEK